MNVKVLDAFDRVTVVEDFARKLDKAEITHCKIHMERSEVETYVNCAELMPMPDLTQFIEQVKNVYHLNDFKFNISYPGLGFSEEYFKGIIYRFVYNHSGCRAFLSHVSCDYDGKILTVKNINGGEPFLKKNRFKEYLTECLKNELDITAKIDLDVKNPDKSEYIKKQAEEEQKLAKKACAPVIKKAEKSGGASEKDAGSSEVSGLIFGKAIKDPAMPIIDVNENTGTCAVEGTVIDSEVREIMKNGKPNGKTAIEFDIGDSEWAVSCSIFSNTDKLKLASKIIAKGARLRLEGDYEYDDFKHKYMIKVKSIEKLPPKEMRMDNAEKKRVELHLHTKMSAMDAVTSAGDLIKRAAKWGHSAIAITDHGVAQAFPEACKACDGVNKGGQDFKVIYGMEGYLIDDTDSAELNKINEAMRGSYVVFDIETTGLSPVYDRITEIGAVKIEDGKIAGRYSQLINPKRPIPQEITELTGITNEMVKDKPDITQVLPEFLSFCKDSTLIAHNAKFDVSFIEFNAKQQGYKVENPVKDTLLMSRELFPKERSHKLNLVAERLGVSLENHHRAVDDANATAEIFIKMMEMSEWREAKALREKINIPKKDSDVTRQRKYHIILLAKNYTGLKNLYKLISKSNLDYFYRKPGIPKSLLQLWRDGIIVGSACEAGELYRAIMQKRPESELLEIAKFYDYLEIQPIGNNAFMLRNGQVKSEEELREINKYIVRLGDMVGRKTVATCDVHFMDPEDEVYRRVMMGAQGFEDADNQAPLYFRTTEEMLEEFAYLGERAEEIVIDNTIEIADKIDNIRPVKDGSYPPTIENCEQDLVDMCHKKAHDIYGDVLPDIVQKRMDRELDCITKYGYSVMYMIAHKLVKKSNEAGYLVGSRGSVGSSFAAFLSGITEVNALCPHYVCPECKYSEFYENGEYPTGMDMPDKNCPVCGAKLKKDGLTIPFETFLGFKGDKVPDIDLNFSGEYQATAHKYVGELFGEEYVFKAGTIGTIADKTAYGFARKYYEQKEIEAPDAELKRVSAGMIDVKRTTGQHPGGIIVCPKTMDIHDFCPVQHPADKKDSDIITTHFDFHSIHDNLLKLDILGHDDPSTIRMLEDLTGINALEIPLDDKETMSIFSSTEALGLKPEQIDSVVGTFGVPEFGTNFVRGMLVDTKPTTFVELLIISGLSHGTDVWLNNAQDLIKAGTATLSEVIGLRDDIMVYLIQHGLEPGMAFKIMEFVRKGRAAKEGMPEEYEKAMRENNVPDWYIESCKKIKYMFPKAHAAAYVMMAFRIAYFKVHYPIEFYIAYYTVRADLFDAALMAQGEDKLKNEMRKLKLKGNNMTANEKSLYTIFEICLEMYERGIEFLPVDLYKSHAYKFQKVGNAILPPLNAFAGVGTAAAESIMEAAKEGKFLSQDDLKNRAGVNKNVIDTLAEYGALGDLPESSQINLFELLG